MPAGAGLQLPASPSNRLCLSFATRSPEAQPTLNAAFSGEFRGWGGGHAQCSKNVTVIKPGLLLGRNDPASKCPIKGRRSWRGMADELLCVRGLAAGVMLSSGIWLAVSAATLLIFRL